MMQDQTKYLFKTCGVRYISWFLLIHMKVAFFVFVSLDRSWIRITIIPKIESILLIWARVLIGIGWPKEIAVGSNYDVFSKLKDRTVIKSQCPCSDKSFRAAFILKFLPKIHYTVAFVEQAEYLTVVILDRLHN